MNKNQITMAAIGGTALVAVLGVGFFVVSGMGEKGEKAEELETSRGDVERLKGAEVAPCGDSVKKIDSNRAALVAWREGALDVAAKGDRPQPEPVSEATFKQKMVDDARELARLPGGVDGCIVKPDFGFGFQDIIKGAAIPAKADLPVLQRQWAEIDSFVRTLSACGVAQLVNVEMYPREKKEEKPEPRRGAKKSGKPAEKKEIASAQKYKLAFVASPAAFVKVLNALATAERFTAVESFMFDRPNDPLAGALGGGKGKESGRRASGRHSGGGRGEGQPGAEEIVKKGLVTDPASAQLLVALDVATYDFGRAEVKAAAEAAARKEDAE